MIVRPATRDDIEAIVRTFVDARSEATPWLPDIHTHDEHLVFYGGHVDSGETLVVEDGDGLVAFAILRRADRALQHLYVRPEAQRRGIGTMLLDEARRAFPDGFTLWTHQGNERARTFYETRGLRAIAFTDGRGNEERTPDVQYEWRPDEA